MPWKIAREERKVQIFPSRQLSFVSNAFLTEKQNRVHSTFHFHYFAREQRLNFKGPEYGYVMEKPQLEMLVILA